MPKTRDQIEKQVKYMRKKVAKKAVQLADVGGKTYEKGLVVGALTALDKVLALFD